MEPADADLLRRYADRRCEASFRLLVERHGPRVRQAALRQFAGDGPAAADVAQRVFVELARNARRLARHPALTGWLHTTVWRMCRETERGERRRRAREVRAVAEGAADAPGATGPDSDPAALASWLDEVLQELGERDRQAVLLRHVEHLPYAEVGRRLGLRENAARMRVDRALERLRSLLHHRGVVSTAAAIGRVLGGTPVASVPPGALERWVAAGIAAGTALRSSSALVALAAGTQVQVTVAGLTALLVGGGLWWQHRGLAHRDAELERLRGQVAVLAADRDRVAAEAALARRERDASEHERAELVRMRGEVARLRVERDEAMARAAGRAATGSAGVEAPDFGAEFNLALAHARIGPGQSLITGGGHIDSEGRETLVWVTPVVEPGADGQHRVELRSRVFALPPELLDDLPSDGIAWELRKVSTETGPPRRTGVLDVDAAETFLRFLESAPGVEVMTSPVMTVADGMQGRILVGGPATGISLDLLPGVTADGGVDLTVLGRIGTGEGEASAAFRPWPGDRGSARSPASP